MRVLWIQWGAMLVAQLMVPTVMVVMGEGAGDPLVQYGVLGLVVPELLFAMVGAPLIFKQMPAQNAYIVRWAMLVSAALFAGVAGFFGAPPLAVGAAVLITVGCMVVVRPDADAYTAWEMDRLNDD